MIPSSVRLGLVLQADRMIVAVLRSGRLETFVVEAEQPSTALRAELDSRQLRVRSAAVALPRSAVTVKPVELPEIGEIGDMVRFELDRHLPFPAEDAPFDYTMVPPEPGAAAAAPGRRVLVTAADRRVVDSAIRLAQDAGIRPTSVTVASHDLVGLVSAPRGRRIAWVHRVGPDADLLLLVGPAIATSRYVPGADDATIASEIKKSLGVVRWRAVDEIWVSGDANAPGSPSRDALGGLGAKVIAPPYTPRVRRLMHTVDHDARGARQLAAAVALGKKARALDLIPVHLRARRITRPQIVTAAVAAATVVLALAALVVPGYRDRARLATLDAEMKRLGPEVRTVERLQRDLERKRALLGTIESLEGGAVKPLPVLRELTDTLPGDAWLTMLSLDGKGAELVGQAAAASSLIPLLENSPRFERVEFASPVTRGRDKEQFRIVARWEGGSPRAALSTPAVPVATAPAPGNVAPTVAVPPPARAPRPPAPVGTVAPAPADPIPGTLDATGTPRRPGATAAVPGATAPVPGATAPVPGATAPVPGEPRR
jgi:Tfp pilus assembly protein PilN